MRLDTEIDPHKESIIINESFIETPKHSSTKSRISLYYFRSFLAHRRAIFWVGATSLLKL